MKLYADGSTKDAQKIDVALGDLVKFNYDGDYSQDKTTDLTKITTSTFGSDGSCDNFVLEYHLKIKYENVEGTDVSVPTFKIK